MENDGGWSIVSAALFQTTEGNRLSEVRTIRADSKGPLDLMASDNL